MVNFEAFIEKFGNKGEKTGWIYIAIPAEISQGIKPNYKKSYRVKGKIDNVIVQAMAMLPMGNGDYIIALNAPLRKTLGKNVGATVNVRFEEDDDIVKLSPILIDCINEDDEAKQYFESLPPSHKQYYSNWVKAAKSDPVIANRIAVIVKACSLKQTYAEMMQQYKLDREILGNS